MTNTKDRQNWGRQVFLTGIAFSMMCWAFNGSALASGTILDANFEMPTYVPGPLRPQASWHWAGSGDSSANVQSSVVQAGTQAVQVSRVANSDRRWAIPYTSTLPTQRYIAIDWDMRVASSAAGSGSGPYFGVEAYDGDTGIYVLGSLGVDATHGDILYQAQDTGYLVESGVLATFDTWHHFRIVLDFVNDTYHGFVNGIPVVTTGFVDRGFNLNNFTDADIATFSANSDAASNSKTGSSYYDNFMIRDGLTGDYDLDGDVDTGDLNRWRATFGTTVGIAGNQADGNGNGVVDAADYVVWRENLGSSLFYSSGSGLGSSLVPEPASLAMCGIGLALFAGMRTRSRRR